MPQETLALTAENFPGFQGLADFLGISPEALRQQITEDVKRSNLIASNKAHLTLEDASFADDMTFREHTTVCGFCRRLVEPFNRHSRCKFPCIYPNTY